MTYITDSSPKFNSFSKIISHINYMGKNIQNSRNSKYAQIWALSYYLSINPTLPYNHWEIFSFSSVQSHIRVWLFMTP